MMTKMKARDLKLGDKVQLFEGAYGWGTVTKVDDTTVHVFRVYVQTSDFAYTGGVIPYTGHELCGLSRDNDAWEYKVERSKYDAKLRGEEVAS